MTLNEPQNYWIELLDEGAYRLSSESGVCNFSKPATVRGVGKLYTLSDGESLIYVGIAQQPMSSRLNFGFKANGESGYHGYKWKKTTTEAAALSMDCKHRRNICHIARARNRRG